MLGAGDGNLPGHGPSPGTAGSASPQGTARMRSRIERPPPTRTWSTPSNPTKACTRARPRTTRSCTPDPNSGLSRRYASSTRSGVTDRRTTPPESTASSASGSPPEDANACTCQRTRSTIATSSKHCGWFHTLSSCRPPSVTRLTRIAVAATPRRSKAAVNSAAGARAAKATWSSRSTGSSHSRCRAMSSWRSRGTGRRASAPRTRACSSIPHSPKRAATAASSRSANWPRVATPRRRSRLASSASGRHSTGSGARNERDAPDSTITGLSAADRTA